MYVYESVGFGLAVLYIGEIVPSLSVSIVPFRPRAFSMCLETGFCKHGCVSRCWLGYVAGGDVVYGYVLLEVDLSRQDRVALLNGIPLPVDIEPMKWQYVSWRLVSRASNTQKQRWLLPPRDLQGSRGKHVGQIRVGAFRRISKRTARFSVRGLNPYLFQRMNR